MVRGPSPATAVRLGVFGSAAVVGLPAAQVLLAEDPTVALQAVEVDVEAMPDAVLRDEIDLALGLEDRDPDRARAMGRAGRRRVEQHFGWDRVAESHEQVYRELTARVAPPGVVAGRAVGVGS